MCGIIAALAERNVVPILLEGLNKLEYRGYDSCGIALIKDDALVAYKAVGKVAGLQQHIPPQVDAHIGIGHTRWATHGKPNVTNAHPHVVRQKIALVHNGIIENYQQLKLMLQREHAAQFSSDTDSEVIAAHIYYSQRKFGVDLIRATRIACQESRGAYAICVLDRDVPDKIVVAKFGSPLVIGVGVGEFFVASDNLALQNLTQDVIDLQDGDMAEISRTRITLYDCAGNKIVRAASRLNVIHDVAHKGKYRHFMLKEIFEQPQAITATLAGRINAAQIAPHFWGGRSRSTS